MATPTDHLADKSGFHVVLLRELTDEQLAEQASWYRAQAATTDHPYGAWCYRNRAQTVERVLAERNGGPTVEAWEAEVERLEDELGI